MILGLALAAPAAANDVMDMFAAAHPTVGLVGDLERGTVLPGLALHFRLDANGDAAAWLKQKGDELWRNDTRPDTVKYAAKALAVPTTLLGHVIGHAEATPFVATDVASADTGFRVGLGLRFGPAESQFHAAVGWRLTGGKPTYFVGWQILGK
jgi:hypothetical protein